MPCSWGLLFAAAAHFRRRPWRRPPLQSLPRHQVELKSGPWGCEGKPSWARRTGDPLNPAVPAGEGTAAAGGVGMGMYLRAGFCSARYPKSSDFQHSSAPAFLCSSKNPVVLFRCPEFPWKSADDLLSTVGKSSCCASPRGGSGQVSCAGARVARLEKQALGAESTPSEKNQPIKRWLIGKMHCIAIRNTCLRRRCPGAVAAAVPVTADG